MGKDWHTPKGIQRYCWKVIKVRISNRGWEGSNGLRTQKCSSTRWWGPQYSSGRHPWLGCVSISSVRVISTIVFTPATITILMIGTISSWMGPKMTPARGTPYKWSCIPVIVPVMISWRRVRDAWQHIRVANCWRELIYRIGRQWWRSRRVG